MALGGGMKINLVIVAILLFLPSLGRGAECPGKIKKLASRNDVSWEFDNWEWHPSVLWKTIGATPDSDISPITGMKVFKHEVWISTYGSDYMPIYLKPVHSMIRLDGVMFLYSPRGLVGDYASKKVRGFSKAKFYMSCDAYHDSSIKIIVSILNKDGQDNFVGAVRLKRKLPH